MFCRGISGFARIGARSLSKNVQRRTRLQFAAVLNRCTRYFSSENVTNTEISSVRLWSDGGGEDVVSNPFDDFGAWHHAEPKSFLHNVSVDTVGKSTAIGHRQANEDSYKLIELQPDLYYFAVFDGHGGSVAVDFVSEHLHDCIKHFYSSEKNIESVLVDAFTKCNSDLEDYCKWLMERGHKSNVLHCGTTATVALLRDGTDLTVASVGDSGALICRMDDAVALTNEHHPSREDEHLRISLFNGWIDWGLSSPKVNGKLAMTRSIGDFHLKPYGVIAIPEIQQLKLDHKTDAFIVLHTDGMSHVMSDKEITDLVRTCPDAEHAANILTSCAIQYGSEDNITAIVIPLRLWAKTHTQQVSKEHSLLKNMRINYM
ncbi:Protein phosphatase 1K, mitochondrial [Desmophyllum pertusum]|uniref:Protein phosphatase 1K, mitochondrial n=1 Tax=Desmophyllum pertusum TaxID=174260 RepID=A0A9W9Z6I7_9CNID|nr:Protein phosphatase 1K, mitochondrial [Desmophyllum pertusum]